MKRMLENENKEKKKTKPTPPPEKRRRQRKAAILVVAAVMLVFGVAYLLAIRYIDWESAAENFRELIFGREEPGTEFIFSTPDYSENIFDDSAYMALDRNLRYGYGGVTYVITDENYARYGADVEFFGEFFACAISGDTAGYNALFSSRYYEENAPLESFTMQKIYDMEITKQRQETIEGVTTYYYVVNYKILDNNGTLRNDVGEGGSRPLAFVLTDREGAIRIDKVLSYKYVDQALQ